MEKFELGFKTVGAIVGDKKDTNFSVLDEVGYSRRFIRYLNTKFFQRNNQIYKLFYYKL